jgi:hypothetical protein
MWNLAWVLDEFAGFGRRENLDAVCKKLKSIRPESRVFSIEINPNR